MSKQHVISKFRFLEFGQPAPNGSRFKGIIGTSTLIGWIEYTSRKEAADQMKERTMHEGGLLGYTSRSNCIRTYSSEGWLDNNKMNLFKKEIAKSFNRKGNLCWDTVISLRNYTDAKNGGLNDINDYAAVVNKVLPNYFKTMGLDANNMIWWMNYHNNKDNPHMHIVFLEKNQTRTKGKLQKKALNKYKGIWLKELGMRNEFQKQFGKSNVEFMKEKDLIKKKFLNSTLDKISMNQKAIELKKVLPKSGRLSYNSIHMKPFRQKLDQLTSDLLNDKEVKGDYEQWLKYVETLDNFQNNLAGDKISSYKDTEMTKLYERIGNMILKELKKPSFETEVGTKLWFSNSFVLQNNEDNVIVKVPHKLITIEIESQWLLKGNTDIMHIVLDDEKDFKVRRYESHKDAWQQKVPQECLNLNGRQIKEILKLQDEKEINQILDKSKCLVSNVNNRVIQNTQEKDTESIKRNPTYNFGVNQSTKKVYQQSYAANLKKGAKRLLSQDERDKEKDLEIFLQQYESQKYREGVEIQ